MYNTVLVAHNSVCPFDYGILAAIKILNVTICTLDFRLRLIKLIHVTLWRDLLDFGWLDSEQNFCRIVFRAF